MDKETTSGLSPKRLAQLLGISLDKDGAENKGNTDQATAGLLRACLSGTLPLDSTVVRALPAIMGSLKRELLPLEGRPLQEVLLDESSEMDAIKKIKEYGKKLAASSGAGAGHATGVAIYYGAIASALVFHDEKITEHSYGSLGNSFATLTEKPWMAPELARLFSRARMVCSGKKE